MDRTNYLNTLMDIANNPETEFDKVIAENKRYLLVMSRNMLNAVWLLRSNANKLCRAIPYSREDIHSLVENNEVDPLGPVTELDYSFTCLDYLFSKVNGKEFLG